MYPIIKRCLDFLFSFIGFIILIPAFFILSLLVLISMGKPVFFIQKRVGKNKRVFKLYKFRTMKQLYGKNGKELPDHERVTKVGSFLRGTSLDELPEIINIIKGDMSIIGPRPLLPEDLSYYKESEMSRFLVRGGLIPPEVMYNNITPTWDEQLKYESQYGLNYSFGTDIHIFFAVFKGLLHRQSVDYGTYERKPLSIERKEMHE